MSQRSFRFIHAEGFRLDRPLGGVAEVPDPLREVFLEAPYEAARRVFDAALAEEVDFVLLCGDLVHPVQGGPRPLVWLVEQFERLAGRETAVYWATGPADRRDLWPAGLELPECVHEFPAGRVGHFDQQRDGQPLARISGAGYDRSRRVRPRDFRPDAAGLFSIAATGTTLSESKLARQGIDYWALGGRPDRATPTTTPSVVHWPGSPQGRSPRQTGAHGCTLVQVDETGQPRSTLVATDVVRWYAERIVVDEVTTREDLHSLLLQRMQAIAETTPWHRRPAAEPSETTAWHRRPAGEPSESSPWHRRPAGDLSLSLVTWTIAGTGPLMAALRHGGLAGELLESLRGRFGATVPVVWTAALVPEPATVLPPAWYEQETILGDYLRAVRQLQADTSEPIELEGVLSERHLAGTLAGEVSLADPATRQRVLAHAALLGVDLLGARQPPEGERKEAEA